MGIPRGQKKANILQEQFHKHFGSSPLDIAECWYDLCVYDQSALSPKEKSDKGFKQFLAAQYWLWAKPKNAEMFASRFGMTVSYVRGKKLWLWIERIANLSKKKIVWGKSVDSKETEIYAISADGVDFKLWERKHPKYPIDTKAMSHKFNSCGAKYLIALSVFQPKCLFIEGPFRGGMGDMDMFRDSGLMKKMKANGKVCIADRGFRSKFADESKHFALPDFMDSKPLFNFKTRVRMHQESYNRCLKHFECLSTTFTHGFVKHGIALRAVAVMVQYQMDNGSPIYCV